jgi:Domain of unknown function (DUF4406)
MRWYIAGPMTGHKDLNFPAFNAEAQRLRSLGYEVVNPAEINSDPNAGWHECMRKDIKELMGCDGVALLPGWESSRGARLEHTIASGLEMFICPAASIVRPVSGGQRA